MIFGQFHKHCFGVFLVSFRCFCIFLKYELYSKFYFFEYSAFPPHHFIGCGLKIAVTRKTIHGTKITRRVFSLFSHANWLRHTVQQCRILITIQGANIKHRKCWQNCQTLYRHKYFLKSIMVGGIFIIAKYRLIHISHLAMHIALLFWLHNHLQIF